MLKVEKDGWFSLEWGEGCCAKVRWGDQEFLRDSELKVQVFGRGFAWLNAGMHDSLSEASNYVEVIEKRQGLKIACLEDIAFCRGWISEAKFRELARPMEKNQYGQYLLKVIEDVNQMRSNPSK